MGAEAKIDMSATDKNVMELIKSISTGFDRMAAAQERVADQSKKTAEAGEQMLGKMGSGIANQIKGIAALATNWLSVDGAIRLATASYDRYKQQAAASAEFGTNYAGARSSALLNAPPSMTGEKLDALIERTVRLSGGRDRVAIAEAYGPTFSAGNKITPEQQSDFIGLAGRLTIGSDPEMKALAKTGVLAGETLGITDPADAMGFLMSGQGNSISPSVQQYGDAAIPVMSAAQGLGFGQKFALAGMNALQKSAGDVAGSSSSTNWITMMSQMAQLRKPLGLGEGADGPAILAALQDPKNAEVLGGLISYTDSDKFKGEQKFQTGMRSLVTGGDTRKEFDSLMGRIVSPENGDQYTEAKLRQIGGDTNVIAYRMRQAFASAAQRNNADPAEIERGLLREGFEELRKSDRFKGVISDTFDGLSFDAGTATGKSPTDIVIAKLEKQQADLSTRRYIPGATMGGYSGPGVYSDPTKAELGQADKIGELLTELRGLRDEMKAVRLSNEKMADAETSPSPNGPPPLTSGAK